MKTILGVLALLVAASPASAENLPLTATQDGQSIVLNYDQSARECRMRERSPGGWGPWSAWVPCPPSLTFTGPFTAGNKYRFDVRQVTAASNILTFEGAPPPSACPETTPHVPGGPDGMDGCWPGPGNTGVPSGVTLTSYGGSCTINTPNTVIDGKIFNCALTVTASNVVVRNSRINGRVVVNSGSLLIEDSETILDDYSLRHLNGHNITARRLNMRGGQSGGLCYNCVVEDSYVHDQTPDPTQKQHYSAFRMDQDLTLRHNTLMCNAPYGCSADLAGYGDFAPVQRNTIERNLFMATEGGTCSYGGSSPSKPYSNDARDIVFRDNVFQKRNQYQSSGLCGHWYAILHFDASRPGNIWENNRWDNGQLISP